MKLGVSSSLKLGRQELSYDDQRILGGLGWAQQARTHDAAVYKYNKNKFSLDFGAALNTTLDDVYNTSALFSYRDMVFLRANNKGEKLNISFLGLVNTFQDSNIDGSNKSSLITAGLHADYKVKALSLGANLFIKKEKRLGGVDVKGALLASLLDNYKVSDKLTLGVGYETISGRTDDFCCLLPIIRYQSCL